MDLAERLPYLLLPVVIDILRFLSVLFVLILTIFIGSTLAHRVRSRRRSVVIPRWEALADDWARSGAVPRPQLPRRPFERRVLRDVVQGLAGDADAARREKLAVVYRDAGFLAQDLRALRSWFWWRRVTALERLIDVRPAGIADAVLPLVDDRSMEVRMTALILLVALRDERLYELIPRFFGRSSRWMYRYIVNRLYPLRIPVPFLKPLSASPDRDYRKAGAILLGQPGNAAAVGPLRSLAGDEVKDVRAEAVAGLGRVGDNAGLPAVAQAVVDEQPRVRAAAAGALASLDGPETLPCLESLARDPDLSVRLAAFHALRQHGSTAQGSFDRLSSSYPAMVREFTRSP